MTDADLAGRAGEFAGSDDRVVFRQPPAREGPGVIEARPPREAHAAEVRQEIHARSRLRFSRPTVMVLAGLGRVAAVVIASLGFGADWKPYALLAGWLALGLADYARVSRRKTAG